MRKELKRHLIVNLSYRLTKQLLEKKIYSQVINNIINNIIKQTTFYYNTQNKDIILPFALQEINMIIEADDLYTILDQFPWEDTPEGFYFWYKIYTK